MAHEYITENRDEILCFKWTIKKRNNGKADQDIQKFCNEETSFLQKVQ